MLKTFIKKLLSRNKVRTAVTFLMLLPSWLLIKYSGIFDAEWYKLQYAGSRSESLKYRFPLIHYILIGRKKGLAPSPFFVGEYFDNRRWQISIQDPLIKYITRRSTWLQPTSVLFDGSRYGIKSKFRPPLSLYVKQLNANGDAEVLYDAKFEHAPDKTWSEIKERLVSSVENRTQQFKFRALASPVRYFDHTKERETISNNRHYFSDSKEEPLVTIVMPAWNREKLVVGAIESVIAQTYQNWELMVVDDGSTDSTVDVVKQYADADSRIKLHTPPHGGVCKARNYGINHASGSWVAFLDSDNSWSKDFLLTSVASLLQAGAKASYSAIEMNNNGALIYRSTQPDPELLESGNYIDLNALVVSKDILDQIGNFDESLRRMVDYDLAIRISKVTNFIYVPIIGVHYTDHEDLARITTTESLSWDGVVKNNNFIDWGARKKLSRKGKTSIIVPVRGESKYAVRALKTILATLDDVDTEIIVVDASSSSSMNIVMSAIATVDDRIVYYRESAVRDVVLATNYGFAHSSGGNIVVVSQHVTVETGWLDPLIVALDEKTIVGPLQLQPSRTVRSAGVEFRGPYSMPVNILEDHPLSDIKPLDDVYETDALMNGCFAIDANLFSQLRGLNPLYDGGFETQDLSLRARAVGAKTVLAKKSTVVNPDAGRGWYAAAQNQYLADWHDKVESKESNLWRQAGFKVLRYEQQDPDMGNKSRLRPTLEVLSKQPGQHRWAIKISSPADERRHVWGDTHYAMALAKSLEKLGQRVAIDYHDYHERSTSYLDDVLLDLRGLDDTQPQAGALNIMWVISHPEKLTPEIVNKFDVVFAAGKKWAEFMSEKSNKTIHFLPQCTDPEVFHPTEPDPKYAGRIIFVGNSRNVLRPIVRDAIAAGIDFDVYGGGWEGLIDKKYIKGTFIPNDRLTYAYSSAAVVLNDHWDDMREWGFISNRIFDALAAGGVVVSDNIYGLHDVVDKGVPIYTYESNVDLQRVIQSVKQADTQRSHSFIKKNHSFDSSANSVLSYADATIDRT